MSLKIDTFKSRCSDSRPKGGSFGGFLRKSALASTEAKEGACYRERAGTELLKTKSSKIMQVGVDSCCTNTLLPPSFAKFILKRNVGERLHIMLAAKGQEMDV